MEDGVEIISSGSCDDRFTIPNYFRSHCQSGLKLNFFKNHFALTDMILEVAILNIKDGLNAEFEAAFQTASKIIATMSGYISHELQHCLEVKHRYVLLVRWQTLEDHTIGFRQSPEYQQWRSLLHHFYDPFPIVEHYEILDRG
jgi:heme-degrading monooxygenase HmoA